MKSSEYFDWTFWRFGYAFGAYWRIIRLHDGTAWLRLAPSLYWRIQGASDHG
jgi:hypothetical protein